MPACMVCPKLDCRLEEDVRGIPHPLGGRTGGGSRSHSVSGELVDSACCPYSAIVRMGVHRLL